MAKETAEYKPHVTPDFSAPDNSKEAAAAAKKVDSLKAEIADKKEEIKELEKELSVQSALARTSNKPGFSNAPSAKEQVAANKAEQGEAKTMTAPKK
jgi:hypothetical protein